MSKKFILSTEVSLRNHKGRAIFVVECCPICGKMHEHDIGISCDVEDATRGEELAGSHCNEQELSEHQLLLKHSSLYLLVFRGKVFKGISRTRDIMR